MVAGAYECPIIKKSMHFSIFWKWSGQDWRKLRSTILKNISLGACGSKSALGSRFGSGRVIQLSGNNYSFKGFWTAFLAHISSLRIFQSRSGENHRNARNPMKTNVKTHVNMCKSMKSKEMWIFLRKKPCKMRKYLEIFQVFCWIFRELIWIKFEEKPSDPTKKKVRVRKLPKTTSNWDFGFWGDGI